MVNICWSIEAPDIPTQRWNVILTLPYSKAERDEILFCFFTEIRTERIVLHMTVYSFPFCILVHGICILPIIRLVDVRETFVDFDIWSWPEKGPRFQTLMCSRVPNLLRETGHDILLKAEEIIFTNPISTTIFHFDINKPKENLPPAFSFHLLFLLALLNISM